jgi:ketosteroid isomerase-like protein
VSQEDVEVVRRMYEAGEDATSVLLAGGDLAGHPWLSLWHPECVLQEIAELGESTEYRGREGIVRYFQSAFGEIWDDWRFVPREIVQGRDGILATVDNSAKSKSGVELEVQLFQVFRLRDGMIAFATGYLDREQALKAVGLEG